MTHSNDDDDDHIFKHFMQGVKPLTTDKVELQKQQPKAKRIHQKRILNYNKSENTGVKTSMHDAYFDTDFSKNLRLQMQTGEFKTDAFLDLHGHNQFEAKRQIEQFFEGCFNRHINKVIIIHGQGHNSPDGSILKPAVLLLLSRLDCVQAFHPAHQKDGGQGATYVYIKYAS